MRTNQAFRIPGRRPRFGLKLVVLAILVFSVSPARADVHTPDTGIASKKTCYCGCEQAAGARACAEMCDLSKYGNRGPDDSCQKKMNNIHSQGAPTPAPHSKKRNRIEDARL